MPRRSVKPKQLSFDFDRLAALEERSRQLDLDGFYAWLSERHDTDAEGGSARDSGDGHTAGQPAPQNPSEGGMGAG